MLPSKRYFYGIRVQLLSTADGLTVEFVFLPGEANDTRGLKALPLNLPEESVIYCDAGYTDLTMTRKITLSNASASLYRLCEKRIRIGPDEPWVAYIKQHLRHQARNFV